MAEEKKLPKGLFAKNIINLLGIERLSEERKTELVDMMGDLVQKRIMLRVMDRLKDEDKDEMLRIEEDPQKVMNLLAEKIPDFPDLIEGEVLKLKEEMLEVLIEKEAV